MDAYFKGTSYETPENTHRLLGDRLLLGSRWYFQVQNLRIILGSRSIAVKGKYDSEAWARSSYSVFQLIEGCGGHFHFEGLDVLRSVKGPVVFVGNHMSTLETFILPCIIGSVMPVTFVVKDSLVKQPLFGPVMRSRDPVVVGRTNPREDFQTVMRDGKSILDGGTSLILFPQSTRTPVFNPEEFNTMGVKLAKSAGVQVVPIALKTDFWSNGKFIKDIGALDRSKTIHFSFHQPLTITGNGKKEHELIVDFITSSLQKWGGIVKEQENE